MPSLIGTDSSLTFHVLTPLILKRRATSWYRVCREYLLELYLNISTFSELNLLIVILSY
jgi:hypothetical protein